MFLNYSPLSDISVLLMTATTHGKAGFGLLSHDAMGLRSSLPIVGVLFTAITSQVFYPFFNEMFDRLATLETRFHSP